MALVETTRLLAGGGEAAGLAVLVNGGDDPVDAGVDADGLVLGVDEDDLVVLVGGVLVDPVRVQDAQVGAAATDTLLGGGLQGALVLQLVDTLVGGLTYTVRKVVVSPVLFFKDFPGRARARAAEERFGRRTYRKWHPWERVSCDHHGGRARGR